MIQKAMAATSEIIYPDCDGKPMADNTKQARWIMVLYQNLEAMFAHDPDVFIAADNLIYPVEGHPEIRQAPDVYVVFGRPKGDRGSYKYWQEGSIPVTIAFEIFSPGNDAFEMADKWDFYSDYGIEEYYLYDPDTNRLRIYVRGQAALVRQYQVDGFVSPRLGIRFDLSGEELVVRYPDGRPFVSLYAERQRADEAEQRAESEHQRAETERQRADQSEVYLSRLRELSRKARRGQATPEELAELERLEGADS
jgi:Uma2 family endonuclease